MCRTRVSDFVFVVTSLSTVFFVYYLYSRSTVSTLLFNYIYGKRMKYVIRVVFQGRSDCNYFHNL